MFITFEGIEGCGKTTQIKRLERRLRARGVSTLMTLEPGGTEIGRTIRQVLLDSRNRNLVPLAELMLYAADRAQHVEEVIRPALSQGKWVLCDRFSDATVAYQGAARGQDPSLINLLNERVSGGMRPDLTLLLDCPVEVGLERALARNRVAPHGGQDRFEREDLEFHGKVRAGYAALARQDPRRFALIDATPGQDEVERAIFQRVEALVGASGGGFGP